VRLNDKMLSRRKYSKSSLSLIHISSPDTVSPRPRVSRRKKFLYKSEINMIDSTGVLGTIEICIDNLAFAPLHSSWILKMILTLSEIKS
jgi:hypothetical protein